MTVVERPGSLQLALVSRFELDVLFVAWCSDRIGREVEISPRSLCCDCQFREIDSCRLLTPIVHLKICIKKKKRKKKKWYRKKWKCDSGNQLGRSYTKLGNFVLGIQPIRSRIFSFLIFKWKSRTNLLHLGPCIGEHYCTYLWLLKIEVVQGTWFAALIRILIGSRWFMNVYYNYKGFFHMGYH